MEKDDIENIVNGIIDKIVLLGRDAVIPSIAKSQYATVLTDFRVHEILKAKHDSRDTLKEVLLLEAWICGTEFDHVLDRPLQTDLATIQDWVCSRFVLPKVFRRNSPFAQTPSQVEVNDKARWRAATTIGLRVLSRLRQCDIEIALPVSVDLVFDVASYTDLRDEWTTSGAHNEATALLQAIFHGRPVLLDKQTKTQLLATILRNRIKPLFAKTRNPAITAQGRKAKYPLPGAIEAMDDETETKPWKYSDPCAVTVFQYIVQTCDQPDMQENWPLVVPPLLALLDDSSTLMKTRGSEILRSFISKVDSGLLSRTGLGEVFHDALTPCFYCLPTLTPEEESIQILTAVFPTTMALAVARFPTDEEKPKRRQMLDKIMRLGVLQGYSHAGELVKIGEMLVQQISPLVDLMGIHSVKFLKDLIPLIGSILSAPFALSYPPLLVAANQSLQTIMQNDWPRMDHYRLHIIQPLCICWMRLKKDKPSREIYEVIAMGVWTNVKVLGAALAVTEVDWVKESQQIRESNDALEDLFSETKPNIAED
ncbi:hypothetical protein MMC25_004980 [Agyrium rufum]|nr:hypothetical protein [Agyrium rufum]